MTGLLAKRRLDVGGAARTEPLGRTALGRTSTLHCPVFVAELGVIPTAPARCSGDIFPTMSSGEKIDTSPGPMLFDDAAVDHTMVIHHSRSTRHIRDTRRPPLVA